MVKLSEWLHKPAVRHILGIKLGIAVGFTVAAFMPGKAGIIAGLLVNHVWLWKT
jgi:hypothetical protein